VICVVDDKILVLDDEQPHLGMRKSFPGGRIDKTDNDVVAAAQREVREETGYGFNNWRLVKVWQPYRKIEWFVHVLLAWEVSEQSEPTPDAGEKISVQQMGFSALKELIMKREGYLGESIDLFGEVEDIDQLLLLPEFQGRQVDR
jgi:8-oxo-dGTP pyrophosphatase MutT (NUDIX family)